MTRETSPQQGQPKPIAADAISRRQLSRGFLATFGLVLSPAVLSGCDAVGKTFARSASGVGGRDAALLLPLTGTAAALGQNMARAATLASAAGSGVPGSGASGPQVFDTEDTPEGAAAAARKALSGGAKLLLGPLRADQTPAVLAIAGQVPVVTFSNDDALAGQGAFVMGVTPAQSVGATFSYVRAQGAKRVAVLATDSALGRASAEAARRIAAAGGLTLTAVLLRAASAGGTLAALKAASGALPDAVFIPDGGADLAHFAEALSGSGVQLLGGIQWGNADVTQVRGLEGAWYAAPPPDLFQPFSDRFEASFGTPPGIVAGLGHDAALMAIGLGIARATDRAGVTRKGGFTGVLGGFRFQADGRCQRDLTILTPQGGALVALGEVADT